MKCFWIINYCIWALALSAACQTTITGKVTNSKSALTAAQRAEEQERLFVRGGPDLKTKILIDGMIVRHPYLGSVPDTRQWGRYVRRNW